MDDRELSRLADAAAALRPDWNARSIRAFLAKTVASKAYADAAVALVVLAVQPINDTPRLLAEHGPWWRAAEVGFRRQTPDVGPGRDVERCDRAGHDHEAAGSCRLCAAEQLTGLDPEPADRPVPAPSGWRVTS